ncbi:hypothetical protein QBZ16_004081 [Prototheca wickerhamii]|uniref:BRX domain-containing protein n=1 Tax=Prototheca wickerhamii TaxID=3111 RepID=A0AAD9MLI6_PROWI|nr:hypothetical protein QBZ16_004081 [Prototheca wickerhamii]
MASERFTIVDGRVMVEEDLLDALHISLTRPLEEVLTTLRKGSLLLKHGRHGRPKVHYFRLMQNDSLLCWRSSSGSVRGVDLRAVSSLVPGQSSDVFRRHPLPASAACSWTLTYTEPVTRARRTLDLTAESEAAAAVWVSGLRLVRAVMTLPGYTQLSRRTSSLGSEGGGAPGAAATRRRSGPAPAQHHAGPSSLPCDLLVWGACSSVRAGSRPWVCSAAPEAAPATARWTRRRWAWATTATRPRPERVGHALARARARAVAAGDDYSAALTTRGALYMWGRLPGGRGQPETVPRLVRGCLGARPVAQVSCGPFHCAAVTADGELFTWGEGFGGRLGHGDVLPRAAPQRAACGVWHTAAIVAESARSAVAAEHNPLEASAAAAAAAAAAVAGSVGHLIAASSSGAAEPGDAGRGLGAHRAAAGGAITSAFAEAAALHAPHGSMGLPLHAPPATPSSGSTRSHRRSSSGTPALSAPPVESSFFHEGVGGALYTPVAYGDRQEKRDSNRGCLAHGDVDLYSGQLLPCRVHTPEPRSFRRVAAGAHLTVVVTTGGRVWQAGITGAHVGALASGASGGAGFGSSGGAGVLVNSASAALERRPAPSACPWEGATTLEPVRGALQGWFVDRIAAGMHHVLAAGRRLDARTGLPLDGVAAVFAWGRGAEGQLGAGAKAREDSAAPVAIEHLRGRGGALAAARFEADARDGAEATARALTGMLDGAGPASAPGSPSRRASSTSFGPAAFLPKSGSAPARALFRTSGLSTASSATSSAGSSARRARPSIKLPVDAVLAGLRAAGPATFGGLGAARPPSIFRASANGTGGARMGLRRPRAGSLPELYGAGAEIVDVQGSVGRDGLEAASSAPAEPLGAGGPPGLRLWSLEGLGTGSRPLSGASHRNASGSLCAAGAASPGTSLGSARSGAAWHDALGSAAGTANGARAPRDEEANGADKPPAAEAPAPSAVTADASAEGRSADAARMLARLPAWSDVASSAPDSSELDATICAMEVFLARKQADLADQERRLAEWAAELRLRELELQRRSSKLMGGGGGAGGPVAGNIAEAIVNGQAVPHSAISAQEKTPNSIRAAATAVDRPAASGSTAGASPTGTSPFQSGGGGAHGAASYASAQSRASSLIRELSGAPSPDGRPEWSEEVDPGVTVTYTAVGGAVRVRRIRFSRTAFTKESAAAWYEARARRAGTAAGGHERGRALGGPAPPAAPLGPAAPSLGRPARAHGHTLSFDVGSEYQESLERSAAGTPTADSPPVRLGRGAAAADGAELRAGLVPPGQLFRPDRTPRAHPIDQASSDGGSGTETPRPPGTPPSLLRQLSARSAALQRQGSGRSALGGEGSVFATPFSPRSTPASAGSGPEESAGSSRSSAVRQLESALDRADADNYLTLIPLSDARLQPRSTRFTVLSLLLFALAVAGLVFITVPRGVSAGEVFIRPSRMSWNTTKSTYQLKLQATIPVYNPNYLKAYIEGELRVLFYQTEAGRQDIKPTRLRPRANPASLEVIIDASDVPSDYILAILSQCSTFPQKLVFFLQGDLTARYFFQRQHLTAIDTYFLIDCHNSDDAGTLAGLDDDDATLALPLPS